MTNASERTIDDFLADLASDSPAPGGGAAAALSGAMAAALVSMVANLTRGRAKYSEFNDLAEEAAKEAESLRLALIQCINKDMSAFDGVMDAIKMPKTTDSEKAKRSEALQEAYKTAILAPVETINNCLEVMKLAVKLTGKSNPNVASDLRAAAINAQAGIDTALENVEINLSAINDPDYQAQMSAWVDKVEEDSEELSYEIFLWSDD
ncbi:MAG: cyclodeaminase/cyclohydrolase family protein [Synergistaceae bacterium]|nr:cyclodeaminase/cyclohydrolase family protein [Synergistaceae bacterium]